MAWKTPGGNFVDEGDRIVWWSKEMGGPDFRFTGTVLETLPVNDDYDGEIRIRWDDGVGPETYGGTGRPLRRWRWHYPFEVELIDKINVLDRLTGHL